jgi:ribose transport system substrate-binding protein
VNIPISSQIPFLQTIDAEMAKVAKRFGIKFSNFSNQGKPAEWAQGLSAAISQKADVAILDGAPDPKVLQPQLAEAEKAGVKTVVTHFYDDSGQTPQSPHLAASVPAGFTTAARLDADWAIQQTKGHAHIIVIESAEFQPHPLGVEVIKKQVKDYCSSDCTVKVVNVPVVDWATKMQSATQSALLQNPDTNYVIPLVDGMTQFVVPAVHAAGKTDSVKVATFNGTPFAMKYLAEGDVIDMIVGESLDWNAWADMDQVMRVLTDSPLSKDEHTALRVFTKDNIAEAGSPPVENKGYGDAYISGYNKIWGAQ